MLRSLFLFMEMDLSTRLSIGKREVTVWGDYQVGPHLNGPMMMSEKSFEDFSLMGDRGPTTLSRTYS